MAQIGSATFRWSPPGEGKSPPQQAKTGLAGDPGPMRRKEGNMETRKNSVNLIRLLASYRRVEFPQDSCAMRTLIQVAAIIESNCEATIRFTSPMLRSLQHD